MYLTLEETAEYLEVSVAYVETLILQKKIRTISDGEQVLILKSQFDTHFKQLEEYKKQVEEWYNESIPESIDVKDED